MSLYLHLNCIKLWICKINLLQNVAFKAETLKPRHMPEHQFVCLQCSCVAHGNRPDE